MVRFVGTKVITGAWPNILADFIRATRQELLIASPWITRGAAKLLSEEISSIGPASVQILARMDEIDFLNGTSHVLAFQRNTYPAHIQVAFLALPLLHGKMLVADRERVIVGSANLTDGGLYVNHEISLLIESRETGEACAQAFFRLWSAASELPDEYLATIESVLQAAMPEHAEEGDAIPQTRRTRRNNRARPTASFKYTLPSGSSSARRKVLEMLQLPAPDPNVIEDRESARSWLDRGLMGTHAGVPGPNA